MFQIHKFEILSLSQIWFEILGISNVIPSISKNLLFRFKGAFQSETVFRMYIYIHFFYKQPVYKQLVLGWQIAKQLSGLNPLSLSNNKNCRLKKNGVFPLQYT